jgi:hypothetical protein
MKQSNGMTPISGEQRDAGFVVPLIGRTAIKEVSGFPGFPLIRAGETITPEIVERAQHMGRLYELTECTEIK